MDLAKHCELCDNQRVDFKTGTICVLTEQKPSFNRTCSKIELNEKFEEKLKQVNIAYENFKRRKISAYTYFVLYLCIGLVLIISGYVLGKYALDAGVISTVPLIIMGISIAPIGLGFGTLIRYRQSLEVAKSKKETIDKVLDLYRITYDINIIFGEEIHGTQEVYAELKTKGIR